MKFSIRQRPNVICKKCLEELPIDSFPFRKHSFTRRKNCLRCESAARLKRAYGRPSEAARLKRNNRASNRSKEQRKNPALVPKHIVKDSKNADKMKGLENDLTIEFVTEQIKHGCIHCGETNIRMTMDRIDNNLGHLKTNVEPACYRCNMIRREMPYEAFLMLAPAIRQARENGLFGDWVGGTHFKASNQ